MKDHEIMKFLDDEYNKFAEMQNVMETNFDLFDIRLYIEYVKKALVERTVKKLALAQKRRSLTNMVKKMRGQNGK